MKDPIKIIHKFKNNNKTIQYKVYIFVGSLVPKEVMSILDSITDKDFYTTLNTMTKAEYEVLENEKKRKLLILKPQFLSVFIGDMKNIMTYAESSQYVDQNTKRGYNSKVMGV